MNGQEHDSGSASPDNALGYSQTGEFVGAGPEQGRHLSIQVAFLPTRKIADRTFSDCSECQPCKPFLAPSKCCQGHSMQVRPFLLHNIDHSKDVALTVIHADSTQAAATVIAVLSLTDQRTSQPLLVTASAQEVHFSTVLLQRILWAFSTRMLRTHLLLTARSRVCLLWTTTVLLWLQDSILLPQAPDQTAPTAHLHPTVAACPTTATTTSTRRHHRPRLLLSHKAMAFTLLLLTTRHPKRSR